MDELKVKLAEIEQRSKSNTHRVDSLEKRQDNLDKLITSVEVLATRQNNVETDLKEVKADVKKLADKSGKRWDSIVEKVILLVVTGIVCYILTNIGLGT